jgi:hypothetical protein
MQVCRHNLEHPEICGSLYTADSVTPNIGSEACVAARGWRRTPGGRRGSGPRLFCPCDDAARFFDNSFVQRGGLDDFDVVAELLDEAFEFRGVGERGG